MRLLTILAVTTAFTANQAHAQSAETSAPNDKTFTLGQIIVTAPRPEGIAIGTTTLSSDAIYTFNRNTLDEAVNLMPGVSSSNSGGRATSG